MGYGTALVPYAVWGMAGHVGREIVVAPLIVEPVQVHWLCLWVVTCAWFVFPGGGSLCAPWPTKGLN
jgi:hypothetical protein